MAHIHSVYDTDGHFVIDPITRTITNSSKKIKVMQGDHKSEHFTFEISKLVDGHNMTFCNKVEIHYINIDASDKSKQSADFYEAKNLKVSEDDNSVVTFLWELTRNATKYAGTLSFLIRFACTDDDGVEEYAWHTDIFQSITVGNGMNNATPEVIEPYIDVIAQWKANLFGVGDTEEQRLLTVSAEQQAAIEAKGVAVLDSIPDEYEALQAQADRNTRIKAGAIVLDAEGESIVLNDASEYPLQNLKVFGRSTQDGTPTPDAPVDIVSANVEEIVAFGGNLIPYPYKDGKSKTMNGITYTVNEDGSILVNGTATDNSNFTLSASDEVVKLPKGWVSTSLGIGFGSDIVQIQNDIFCDGVYLTTIQNQLEKSAKRFFETNVEFRGCRIKVASGVTVNNVLVYPVFCCSENAIPYERGVEKQTAALSRTLPGIPVSSGGNYTDANGQQWICDEVDLARGVYVQRIGRLVVDGTAQWHPYNYETTYYGFHIWDLLDEIHSRSVGLCNQFETVGGGSGECIWVGVSNKNIYAISKEWYDKGVDAWKAHLNVHPLEIVYARITPIETPLSVVEIAAFKALHSNKPVTTILNDAGAYMAVEYVADTKTYIDNKIKELAEGVTV